MRYQASAPSLTDAKSNLLTVPALRYRFRQKPRSEHGAGACQFRWIEGRKEGE